MGHSMTLFLITLVLYSRLTFINSNGVVAKGNTMTYVVFAVLASLAIFCLYKSQVRSAILGLLVFASVYLIAYNKKLFLIGAGGLTVLALVTLPYWLPVLLPDVWLWERGRVDVSAIGSGRQTFWVHNLQLYASLPIDRQLAGVGIGNRDRFSTENVIDSHNDWLDVLMQTGAVGLLLLLALQILILKAILRVPGHEKYAFLSVYLAVIVMMFVSNSYVWRIQVGHIYYIMLAYIEIRQTSSTEVKHTVITTDHEKNDALSKYG
jgi:O-antigen ligase